MGGLFIFRGPNDPLQNTLLEFFHELIVNARLNINPAASTAVLSLVGKYAIVNPRNRLVKIGIIENNVRRFSS